MKKVVITGGNGDIAQAIKNELVSLGDYEVKTPGKDLLDVTDVNSVKNYFTTYCPDILINNAGFVLPQSIGNGDSSIDKKTIDINLYGTFNCTSAVLSKNAKALIINIGSSAATKVHGTWSAYCASKAGVVMATKCWAEDGYFAICISPGRTATKMRRGLYPKEDQSTLLACEDFAKVVLMAIDGKYTAGMHINVTKQNVEELLDGTVRD